MSHLKLKDSIIVLHSSAFFSTGNGMCSLYFLGYVLNSVPQTGIVKQHCLLVFK